MKQVTKELIEGYAFFGYLVLGVVLFVFYRDQIPTALFWAVPVTAILVVLLGGILVDQVPDDHPVMLLIYHVWIVCLTSMLGYGGSAFLYWWFFSS